MLKLWEIYSYFYDNLNKLIPYRDMIKTIYSKMELNNNSVLFDAGCGTGNLSRFILDNADIKINAVDFSESMMKVAKPKMKSDDNIEIRKMDLNSAFDFENDTFNYMTSINVLYTLSKPENLLNEAYRVLKLGGKLILANPISNVRPNKVFYEHVRLTRKHFIKNTVLLFQMLIIGLLNALIVKKGKKNEYHFFEKDEILDILKNIGFKNITAESAYADQNFLFTAVK